MVFVYHPYYQLILTWLGYPNFMKNNFWLPMRLMREFYDFIFDKKKKIFLGKLSIIKYRYLLVLKNSKQNKLHSLFVGVLEIHIIFNNYTRM